MAKTAGKAETINAKEQDSVQAIHEMTDGRGADVVVDAMGMEADISFFRKLDSAMHLEAGTIQAFSMAVSAVRRRGTASVVGSLWHQL